MEYRKNHFNLLRLFLASLVLVSHAPELLDGDRHRELLTRWTGSLSLGELAVALFFAISGYLVSLSWERTQDWKPFLEKRARRILPGFLVAFLLSVFVAGAIGAIETGSVRYFQAFDWKATLWSLVSFTVPRTPSTFPGHPYANVNGSLWTIRYEVGCYLMLAGLGAFGLLRRRWPVLILFLGIVFESLFLAYGLNEGVETRQMRACWCFVSGAWVAQLADRHRHNRVLAVSAGIALAISLFSGRFFFFTLLTAGTYLTLSIANARIDFLEPFQRIPDISYGVYLYSWPVEKLLIQYMSGIGLAALIGLSWLFSMLLGWLSWKWVESPFLKRGRP